MKDKKIFVIEDDQAIIEVVSIILEGEGYNVLTAEKAESIDSVLREHSPHLILLDIWLGGHDGGIIAKQLKSTAYTKQIPVIMMSANNETEKIAKSVGADGFLLKPFTIDELLLIVKKYI